MPENEPAPRSSEQLLTVLSPVMELIASGPRLGDVLRALATFIDHQSPVGRCCISLTDEDGATLRLCAAADVLDLPLLDHLIVGDEHRYYSFREAGLMGVTPADR